MRCECGLAFATGERPAERAANETKKTWENVGGAVFLALVCGATSIIIALENEFPRARIVFAVAAAIAIGLAIWAWSRLPLDRRALNTVSKRSLVAMVIGTSIVIVIIAYGLHDYLSSTYVVGHECTQDKDCRSSHCFGGGGSPGVCTGLCDTDEDCPSTMMCNEGRSVRPGEQLTGGGTPVHFCMPGRRAAPN